MRGFRRFLREGTVTRSDVRAAVEAAIRQRLGARSPAPPAGAPRPVEPRPVLDDPGHGRFLRAVLPGDPPEGRCVIEPAVECTGCGYCQSHGH